MPKRSGPQPEPPVTPDPGGLTGQPDPLEMTDLGERRLGNRQGDRLDIPPGVPREPGIARRPPAWAVLAGALVLLVVAVAGADLRSPRDTATVATSSSPGASVAPSPDACPSDGLPPPTVTLARRGWTRIGVADPTWWPDPTLAGFPSPTEHFVDARAGDVLQIAVQSVRCVDELRVQLGASGSGRGLGFEAVLRAADDDRTWNLSAPVAGDWTVRVALRLRGTAADSGPWAVYLYRLRVDGAAWVEPIPDGEAGSEDPGMLVSPMHPCGSPDPTATAPPRLILSTTGSDGLPATTGAFWWNGAIGGGPGLDTLEPVPMTLGSDLSIRIDGDLCALAWDIGAGKAPAPGAPYVEGQSIEVMDANPRLDPGIAAQNEFRIWWAPMGQVVIRVRLDFGHGEFMTAWWRLDITEPDLPKVRVGRSGSADTVVAVRGCGAQWQPGLGSDGEVTASEICPLPDVAVGWLDGPDIPTLEVRDGDTLRVRAAGRRILAWQMWAREGDAAGSERSIGSAWFQVDVYGVNLPVMGPGEWLVRIDLTLDASGQASAPYYLRLVVTE